MAKIDNDRAMKVEKDKGTGNKDSKLNTNTFITDLFQMKEEEEI